MTLVELCEPLFQYVCRLNRSARKGGNVSHAQIRADIENLLKTIKNTVGSDARLAQHWDKDRGKIELVMAFFTDFMIRESKLPFAREWQPLAAQKYNELSGDEKFWDLLEETLADRTEAANERLAIFFVCIGLGFTGWYSGQPEHLRRKMQECKARIQGMIDSDDSSPIVSEAEMFVNTANLIEPPSKSLVGIGIALVGLILVLFVGNIFLYKKSTSDLNQSLDRLREGSRAGAASTTGFVPGGGATGVGWTMGNPGRTRL